MTESFSPIHCVRHEAGNDTLLVMLPGAYMQAEDFLREGCIETVKAAGADLDLCFPALDLSAITGGEAMPAVVDQLLVPARQRYAKVWLGGISLGGELAMLQAAQTPALVDGLCLLAPYPGSRITLNALAAAGGVDAWEPTPAQLRDPEFRLWQWLKQPPATMPVFVGYGEADRFAAGMAQVASRFAHAVSMTVPGPHDWTAWRPLWQAFVNAAPWLQPASEGMPR